MQQQGSGASPTAQHTLHSKQQVMHSSAQPIFGGNSRAALQQQQPSTITAFEQHPMAGRNAEQDDARCSFGTKLTLFTFTVACRG
eukprot:2476565-Prymnesium_polylepis.4